MTLFERCDDEYGNEAFMLAGAGIGYTIGYPPTVSCTVLAFYLLI